jgi:hypothetical protein
MAENEASTATEDATEVAETEEVAKAQKNDVPPEVTRALHKANKEAETLRLKLKEFEDRDKTDSQKIQEERDALKTELGTLTLQSLRRDVADEKGLTPAQARRLVGSTREEMEADADDLITTFPKAKPQFGNVGQGARGETAARIYSASELNNFAFFTANKADILLAQREGRITSD